MMAGPTPAALPGGAPSPAGRPSCSTVSFSLILFASCRAKQERENIQDFGDVRMCVQDAGLSAMREKGHVEQRTRPRGRRAPHPLLGGGVCG